MRVTPLDIIQKKFSMNKKGYDPEEVGAFLEEVREGLEELIRENHEQKGSLSEKDKEIARLRSDEDAVKETIAKGAPGGGYILASSNSIHPAVRPENYRAMVEAARRWGEYPLDSQMVETYRKRDYMERRLQLRWEERLRPS